MTDAKNASNRNEFVEAPGDAASVNKGLSNDVITTRLQDTRIKGRKVTIEKVTTMEMMKDLGLNGGSAEISGATHTSRKCDHEREEKIHVESKLRGSSSVKPKTSDPVYMESTGNSGPEDHPRTPPNSSRVKVSATQEPYNIYQKTELKKDLKDAIVTMGLLNMDY
ncbi:hypothetical protein MRB53_028605 [Persea americana]|uniref:Uncharacterized protein n=1 Tax=Persea americana TaxID=3435 RepID=A0ACC2KGD8_PERAE|nr:hypothetical protein MRB53_028605 [Persea americana]